MCWQCALTECAYNETVVCVRSMVTAHASSTCQQHVQAAQAKAQHISLYQLCTPTVCTNNTHIHCTPTVHANSMCEQHFATAIVLCQRHMPTVHLNNAHQQWASTVCQQHMPITHANSGCQKHMPMECANIVWQHRTPTAIANSVRQQRTTTAHAKSACMYQQWAPTEYVFTPTVHTNNVHL